MLSIIGQHAGDRRRAHELSGAIVTFATTMIVQSRLTMKLPMIVFVGKSPTHTSVLAPGSVAIQLKGNQTHGGDGSWTGRQD
jgi:hypothetical protein